MASGGGKTSSGPVWALALHGGADPNKARNHSDSEKHMQKLLKKGAAMLADNASAVDVVFEMVRELEDCGFHVAGKGAAPNSEGHWELDAAIMDGETRNAGAVMALQGIRNPIEAARAVMDDTPHVMLAGEGAFKFAKKQKLKRIKHPERYYTPAKGVEVRKQGDLAHGTVGAVALDADGLLAAATSTGGVRKMMPGRIGDSPIIGAGVWADERVAVACTGIGEYFLRTTAASDISARIRYARQSVEDAARATLDDVGFLGGEGGMIAIDCLGRITMPFNTKGMKRGSIHANGQTVVATF